MSLGAGLARGGTAAVGLICLVSATVIISPAASAATISQTSPFSGSIDVAGSAGFTYQLVVTGNTSAVTFTTTPNANLSVSSSGAISVIGGPLAVTNYTVSGTDADADSDTGSWTYTLTVTPDVITQASPTSGSVSTTGSAAFSTTLTAASGFVDPVTFTTSTSGFAITGGDVLESTGALSASGSPYTISGSDSDAYGDSGSWTYSLAVNAAGTGTTSSGTLIQTSPKSGTVVDTASQTFTAGPITVSGSAGPVTFVTTQSNSALTVSAVGLISSTKQLAIGTYVVSGTDADIAGDTGTWTYSLSVTGVVSTVTFDANGGAGSMPAQSDSAPTALALKTFTRANYTFVDWNTVAGGSGVAYANGAVFPFSSSTTLYAQWKLGKSPRRTINLSPNGGKGAMRPEVDNTPTAISPNRFTRAGYTFAGWSSSSKGSGDHFGAGATYNFKKSVTLFARWRKVPTAPLREVTFFANGGAGQMAVERGNKTATLTPNHFVRKGYTFLDWHTTANGPGAAYANGGAYSFAASTNLYAQWKKAHVATPHHVTFSANGGVGTMAVETGTSTRSLTDNQFTRTGYTFAGWNTEAIGLGTPYANGVSFSFDASMTLYAQWKPANATDITAGPFGHGSSTLSSALDGQIQSMANAVKSKGYTQIALLGYGDSLTSTELSNATTVGANAALGRARAQSVAEYLEARLAALGVANWSISISGTGTVHSGTGAATVIATLS
jgi:uncharacterized repeat protein (TIGR02543 family)